VAINDVLIVMEMDWLPEIEWKVLLALAHIKNHKTGLCYPSYEEISRIAHTSRNSVALSIPKLKDRGLLSWTPGNQHYSNRELDPTDVAENEYSVTHGFRLPSSYQTDAGERLWIITEADRSATTLLLPEGY
jgi:hypothetical protein